MPADRPPSLDPIAAARWAARVVTPAQGSPWLHEEVARRMEERLGWIRAQPGAWAHWGALRGGLKAHEALLRRYPTASCYVVEQPGVAEAARHPLARPWWHPARWAGQAPRLALPPQAGVNMVWANMLLHQVADPQALIGQWQRALAVDGYLMFSCFGPDTLRELRRVYQSLGWPEPAHEFTDMHDWGDMLVQAGFAEPVMDMERITLSYESPQRLLRELRELGRNLHAQRFGALRGRAWQARLHEALAAQLAVEQEGGRLCLTFEIVYGHAFKPTPRLKIEAQSEVSLEDMRAMLRRSDRNTPPA